MKLNREILKARIVLLEKQQALEKEEFNQQLKTTFDSLKLSNLIKSSIREITQTTMEIKGNILEAALPLIANYVSGRIANKKDKNSFYQVVATLAQMALTNYTAKHSHSILETLSSWMDQFSSFFGQATDRMRGKAEAETIDEPESETTL